ncbi:MAG TPA: two-component regulator propeller domain-containing protein [Steroidobacteraceae bacterium]|nr:two-component regulator propeller domain-containing protein [Steroidobacteraceae bacterium]
MLVILLAWCPCVFALDPSLAISQYGHTSWSIREGFFKGTINAIAQTPDGYLWLGTEFGLLRFDGVRSVAWTPPAGEPLPSSEIDSLLVSRSGALWIGTAKGLVSWSGRNLTQYPDLAGHKVDALLEDHAGTVWAGLQLMPNWELCAIKSGSAQCHGDDGSLGLGAGSLFEERGGNLWAGTGTGLFRWKPSPPHIFTLPPLKREIHAFAEGDNGALLIAVRGGIVQLVDGKAAAYPLPGVLRQFNPFSLLRDRNGGLWIGTKDRGLLHVHQGRTDVFAQHDGLSGDRVTSLLEDVEGNVWVATVNGLERFRDFPVTTISVKQGLSSASVESVLAARDGSVWIGTRDGLNRWHDGENTIYRTRGPQAASSEDKREHETNGLGAARKSGTAGTVRELAESGLPDNQIGSLFEDDRGRIWVSTPRGVAYFESGRFVPVRFAPSGFVHAITQDSGGYLWMNPDQGLFHLSPAGVVEQISWAKLGPQGLAFALVADPLQGGLWLGFSQGGVAYFKDGQVRRSYVAADGLGEGRVTGLLLDRDDTLWAATHGGLTRVRGGRASTLTSKNGLPCDAVHWVAEDDAHSFWLNTACGLVRVARPELDLWVTDPARRIEATVFESSDGVGLHSNTVSGSSPRVAKSKDGKLWFLSGDGVSVLDPRYLLSNKLPPPVHIEQITADRETYQASSPLHLPPLIRDLEIGYTALSLTAPEKNLFRYKLEGHDRDWQSVGNRRDAFYSDLPPGNYRFRVTASNNNGVWNEQGAALDFSIAPAYWQTLWFRAACAAVVLATLWALYLLRVRQIARVFNARLEERVAERSRIARDLHDTLLQGIQGLLLRFQTARELLPTRPAEAEEILQNAIDRTAQAITEGREAVQGLRASTLETNDLAIAITKLGEDLATAANSETAVQLHTEVEGTAQALHPIVRDEIYRIASEALRNAFRHAEAKHIEVELRYDERALRLRIRDDGKGIDPNFLAVEGREGHFGLRGMRERAKLIGGTLTVWTAPESGTEIELTVPATHAYAASSERRRSWLAEKFSGNRERSES